MDLRSIVLEGKIDICISGVFGKDQTLYLPPDLEGLGIVEMSDICGCLAFGVDSGNPILERDSIKLEECSALRFVTPAAKYLDFYRQSFTLMCQQEGGFTPKYEYKPVGNHRFFYSEGPGNCAYMLAGSLGGGGYSFLTPAVEATVTKIMFPEIQAFPIAVYNVEAVDDVVVEFAESLGRSIR